MIFARPHLPDFHHNFLDLPKKSGLWTPRIPHFFSLASREDLSAVLRRPDTLFVEIVEPARLETAIMRLTADMPAFALSLTTASAYRRDIAAIVTSVLHERFPIHAARRMDIATCLHEALINAVVHGNLSLESRMASPEDFASHYAAIEERIGKALYKGRRINIAAWQRNHYLELRISDEGQGFFISPDAPISNLPHGRGLFLIRSLADDMWIAGDRCTLCMIFKRHPGAE